MYVCQKLAPEQLISTLLNTLCRTLMKYHYHQPYHKPKHLANSLVDCPHDWAKTILSFGCGLYSPSVCMCICERVTVYPCFSMYIRNHRKEILESKLYAKNP